MANTITIKKRWDCTIIFSHTCENNTYAKTIYEAIKKGISLKEANLSYMDLSGIDLYGINLSCADFTCSCLNNAILKNANLSASIFYCTELTNANLSGAILTGANFDGATTTNIDITNVIGLNDHCPKEGSFIAWKKCIGDNNKIPYIVKLEIPTDAKRSSSTSNKCRCSKAKVLEIQNLDGTIADIDKVYSYFNLDFEYKVNEIVKSDSFDDNFWKECSHGIHFFMNRQNAVMY